MIVSQVLKPVKKKVLDAGYTVKLFLDLPSLEEKVASFSSHVHHPPNIMNSYTGNACSDSLGMLSRPGFTTKVSLEFFMKNNGDKVSTVTVASISH